MSFKFPVPNLSAGYRSVQKLLDVFTDIGDLFDNTLSRDGTAPNQMEAALDMNSNRIVNVGEPVADTDAVRLIDLAGFTGGGEGGGGSVLWDDVLGKPLTFPPTDHSHTSSNITDFDSHTKSVIGSAIVAGADIQVNYDSSAGTTTITSLAGGGGGSGQEPVLLSEFGPIDGGGIATSSNDSTLALAEAAADSEVYLPDGVYAKTPASPTGSNLTKHYTGRGVFLEGTSALPADFSYMATKPSTFATQGITGWFRGDQRFTDGGEYRIIGTNVRRYDTTSRYFESNTIPHHAWFDVNSGNSGVQAFLTGGATPAMGTVIPLNAAADPAWVGKTVGFCTDMDGTPVETKTISAVNTAGNNITINTALSNTYTWNPAGGLRPCLLFGHRTWAGHTYVKTTAGADGGGDVYGHIVRQTTNYVPKPTEYHTFMAGTTGQYGGDQFATTDGVYMTGWESQQHDQGHDIAAIGFVQSFIRDNDTKLDGGRFWAGTHFQSSGTRPGDVAHNILGLWRNGVDMVQATLYETSRLIDPTISSGSSIHVASTNGAHVGDTLAIGTFGVPVYTGSINAVNPTTKVITVTPNLPAGVIAAGSLVTYHYGGAALNLKSMQRIIWNSSSTTDNRSGDPTGAFATFYGNTQGDLIEEAGVDGAGEYWSIRFNRGASAAVPDTARLRLRTDGVQIFGNLNMTGNIGLTGQLYVGSGQQLGLASGVWFEYNGSNVRVTKNGGSSFTTIV
jgi:hypothetical protein